MSQLGSGPIEGSYWVQEAFIAGDYPGGWGERDLERRLRALLGAGVTFFLDLTEPWEKDLPPYDSVLRREARLFKRVVQYARLPVPDFETPTVDQMRHILDLLDAALAARYTLYLHCHAGIGRTGTVVGCFLVRHGWDGQAALDEIVHLRRALDPGGLPSPITRQQRDMVRGWARHDRVRPRRRRFRDWATDLLGLGSEPQPR